MCRKYQCLKQLLSPFSGKASTAKVRIYIDLKFDCKDGRFEFNYFVGIEKEEKNQSAIQSALFIYITILYSQNLQRQ